MTDKLPNTVAIIIPTKNEEGSIKKVIDSILPISNNIYVIDGNSEDKTRDIATSCGVKVILQKGKGKGNAIKQAIETIQSDILVMIDADGSHKSEDIPLLVKPILEGRADMVIASRFLGGSDELHGTIHNFIRMVGSSLVTLGINYRWNVRLTDVENGFRAIKRESILKIKLNSDDFTIEQEMVIKMLKKGFKIIEIASHEYERISGESKLSTWQGWKFVWEFLKDIW